jgi:hypothetical protein
MRTPSRASIIARMPTEPSEIRLILLIDLDADPITGSLETADGQLHGFSGWIGLTATLSAIRYAERVSPIAETAAHTAT